MAEDNSKNKEEGHATLRALEKSLFNKDPLLLLDSGYLYINSKTKGIIPLVLNHAQRKLLDIIIELRKSGKPPRIVILKARQMGMSTLTGAVIFVLTHFQEGVRSVIIADDTEGSNYLLEMSKLYHEKLGNTAPHLKIAEKRSNEKKLEFEGTHSTIHVETANDENAGRSHTYRYAHLSEVAMFAPNKVKDMMSGLMNTIPKDPNSLVIAESTAKGFGNYFQILWDKAERGESDWYPLFLPWYEDPTYVMTPGADFELKADEVEYQKDVEENTKFKLSLERMCWRRWVVQNELNGDGDQFKQEYPAYPSQAFLVSGRNRFNTKKLMELKARATKPIRKDGLWDIWESPVRGANYVIGVDTAEGLEVGDNSVAVIIDPRECKIVAKLRGKIEPELLAWELKKYGEKYNEAHISVESNNHGGTVIVVLKDIYHNLYTRKVYDQRGTIFKKQIGFQTNIKTKKLIIDNLAMALNNGFEIPCYETIDEMLTFVVNENGSTSAEIGKLDDEVLALAIANQARIEGSWETEKKKEEPKAEEGSLRQLLDYDKRKKKSIFRRES